MTDAIEEAMSADRQIDRLRAPVVVDGYNHFEVIETLANPYGALEQIEL